MPEQDLALKHSFRCCRDAIERRGCASTSATWRPPIPEFTPARFHARYAF